MNRNHLKTLKRSRRANGTRSAFATASFILAASLLAVLLAACPSTNSTVEDAPPGAPTLVTATADTAGNITLSWTAPTDTGYIGGDGTKGVITKYTVYHSESTITDLAAAGVTAVEVTGGTTLTKEVTGLTDGTPYFFKITATNATGESAASEEKTATPVDTTAPTFTVIAWESGGTNIMYLKANEAITLLGTADEQKAKLTVMHDDGGANPTHLSVYSVTLQNDGMTVKIETNMVQFILGQEVSVVIAEGFAADKAATPNNNIAATVKTTVALDPTVTSVTINEGNQNLDAGGTVQLSATVTGTNNPSQIVSWKSSDTNVATVSTTGLVTVVSTATGGQTATITAESEEGAGITGTITVTVN